MADAMNRAGMAPFALLLLAACAVVAVGRLRNLRLQSKLRGEVEVHAAMPPSAQEGLPEAPPEHEEAEHVEDMDEEPRSNVRSEVTRVATRQQRVTDAARKLSKVKVKLKRSRKAYSRVDEEAGSPRLLAIPPRVDDEFSVNLYTSVLGLQWDDDDMSGTT
jgi:hypothetical protein